MSQKKLIGLIVAAVVLVGLAYLSNSHKRVKAPELVGRAVLKQFDLSEVAKVEIGSEGQAKLVLASGDSGWVIKSLYDYPADIVKIRENLLKLQDLKAGHVATGKKLESPLLVDLQDSAGKSLAALLLGDKHQRQPTGEMAQYGGGAYPDGRYVVGEGSDTPVLVKETLEAFDGDPKSWCETRISSVETAEIEKIELTQGDATVKLHKKDGTWSMDGLGEKEEFDTSKGYSMESALGYLSFNNVVDPALTEEELGLTTGAVYKVALKSGENFTAKIGNKVAEASDRYFKLAAGFTAVGTNEVENAALEQKVAQFNDTIGKWTYVISSYNADNMRKGRSDLVKAKEEPKENEKKEE